MALSYPGISWGLGLGEIESASSLNQPFKAKIDLLSINGADIRNLNVKVASPSIFRRVGIDRPAYLNGLRFRSVMENGKPVIVVSSSQPVQEPFINFLLEVSWPKGQLLKEYTVLLDPPVLMQPGTSVAASNTAGVRAEPARAVQQPRQAASTGSAAQQATRAQMQRQRVIAEQRQRDANAQRRQQALQQQRQRAQASQAAPQQNSDGLRRPGKPIAQRSAAATTTRNTNGSRTYRVRSGDTLYKVAARTGYQGVRTEQMMMALFEANPTAFRKRNINNLKAGVDLRRPSINEAKRISLSQARQQIRSQSSEWKSQRKTQVASSNKAPLSRDTRPAETQANAPRTNNKLVEVLGSTDSNNSANSGNLSGQSKVNNLNRQLTLASESLSARNRENDELKSRVSELESLLRKKNRLITLKNEQLAELQVSMGQPPTAMTDGGDEQMAQIADPIKAQGEAIGNVIQGEEENGTIVRNQDPQQAIMNDTQPEVFETPIETEDLDDVLSPPSAFVEKEKGILDIISSPMVLGLGAGSLAALLLGFLFLRRRNAKDEYDDYSPIDFDDPTLAPGATDFESDNITPTSNDAISASDDPFAGLGEDAKKVELNNDFNVDPADELLSEPSLVAAAAPSAITEPDDLDDDGDDILQEADVYIVYGLHEQAEVELKKAIEKEPKNLEYRAKLLENYNASDNKEAFEVAATEFAQMDGATKGPLWDKVSGWGRTLLPASPLFAGPGVAAAIQDTASKAGSGLGSKLGLAAGAAAVGGIAVSAGKAIADTTGDKLSGAKDAVTGAVDDFGIDMSSLDDTPVADLAGDLPDLGDSLDFDEMDLDSMLSNDVELPSADIVKPEIVDNAIESDDLDFDFSDFELDDAKDAATEAGMEVPELVEGLDVDDFSDLDLDLGGSEDDLLSSLDDNDLGVANLNLALDGSSEGVGKILPESSGYKMSGDVKAAASSDALGDLDDDLSFLDLGDDADLDAVEGQVGTKLDLARAYIDMGDVDGARGTLEEVLMEGNDAQRKEAEELLHKAG
ncbi:FimV/HubP family polar landmark protein [Leucothrix arctica]|nr:FimV/HubP family polar landmark protein [Leucothrix arctica]